MADITPSGMRQLLDEERGELMSRIRMSGGFSAHLYSEGVIDGFQRAHLEEQGGIEWLIDHVRNGDMRRYQGFIDALWKSGQEHIVKGILKARSSANYYQSPGGKPTEQSTGTSHATYSGQGESGAAHGGHRMSPIKQWLIDNRSKLMEILDMQRLWPPLIQAGVLDEKKKNEIITNNKRNAAQVSALIDYLLEGPDWKVHAFKAVIKQADYSI